MIKRKKWKITKYTLTINLVIFQIKFDIEKV